MPSALQIVSTPSFFSGRSYRNKFTALKKQTVGEKPLVPPKAQPQTALASVKVLGPLIAIAVTNRPTWVVAIHTNRPGKRQGSWTTDRYRGYKSSHLGGRHTSSNIFCQEEPAHRSARRGTRSQRARTTNDFGLP